MSGWRDKFLAIAITLAFAGGMGLGLTLGARDTQDTFTLEQRNQLFSQYPNGRYIPNRERARYYQVCIRGYHLRFFPDGTTRWAGECWW